MPVRDRAKGGLFFSKKQKAPRQEKSNKSCLGAQNLRGTTRFREKISPQSSLTRKTPKSNRQKLPFFSESSVSDLQKRASKDLHQPSSLFGIFALYSSHRHYFSTKSAICQYNLYFFLLLKSKTCASFTEFRRALRFFLQIY